MSGYFTSCRRHRKSIGLRAVGVLPEADWASLERHLAGCNLCRAYQEEIMGVAAGLHDWNKTIATLQPSPGAETRWDEDFAATCRNESQFVSIIDWWRNTLRPGWQIWTGFVAVWLLILVANFSARTPMLPAELRAARPSRELVRAYLVQVGFLPKTPT